MPDRSASVSIIMPTAARADRAAGLFRAIESVVSQLGARAIPLVVVNGLGRAAAVMEPLARRRDIRLITLDNAGLRGALEKGRTSVDTPYFATLDDDDELLPGALQTRLQAIDAPPAADVVVTNGFFEGSGRQRINIADFSAIEADPLRTILEENWLSPCAGLFRTDAIPPDMFRQMPEHLEWTYLGLRIALTRRIRFVSQPTFRYRTDTPGSLSKSKAYCVGLPRAVAQLLELELPADVRATLQAKLVATLHSASDRELRDGNHAGAWLWHLKCLMHTRGWRHVAYTRHLLTGTARSLMGAAMRARDAP